MADTYAGQVVRFKGTWGVIGRYLPGGRKREFHPWDHPSFALNYHEVVEVPRRPL